MRKKFTDTYFFKLFLVFIFSILIDYLLLNNANSIPGWDQGYHLSNVFKMHNLYGFYGNNYQDLWSKLLNVTDSYRGPLTYFFSSLFLKIFGISYKNAYLSNHIYSLICIFSIYELGKIIFNRSAGLWAAIIFTFSPLIISQRTDYLIDLSLTAFVTLNFLFLTRWFLSKSIFSIYSIISGLTLGLVFLVKPTGITLLILPLLITISKRIFQSSKKFLILIELIVLCSTFLLIIYPWFSKNWLTILSSIINAWQWGVKYQEGFEINDIKSWFFYIFRIPDIIGKTNFWTLISIFLYRIFYSNSDFFNYFRNSKKHFLYLSFFINVYLITSIMSTKEIRFFLPVLPIICIFLSALLNSKNKLKEVYFKRIILIGILITTISYQNSLLGYFSLFKNNNFKEEDNFLHQEIIHEISKGNKNLISTLAVLPDTREINTFNLEAEASKEGEYVAVRQIISNKDTYKLDLQNFDWFLIKTGNQGVMKNEARELIEQKLYDNKVFAVHKEWVLSDKSYLRLIKRRSPSILIEKSVCKDKKPIINVEKIDNGLKLITTGNGKSLKSSKLLLNIKTNNKNFKENISLANGMFHPYFKEKDCYSIEQNIPIKFNLKKQDKINKLFIEIFYINNLNKILFVDKKIIENYSFNFEKSLLMANKIKTVEQLGLDLKFGRFDNLFKLVEILNQSDPKQVYLKDAEDIYTIRYKMSKNVDDLYSVLISQILQRKANTAKNTTDILLKNHGSSNQNIYISQAVINLYLLNIRDARLSINNAKSLSNSVKNDEIIKTIDNILNILEFKSIL